MLFDGVPEWVRDACFSWVEDVYWDSIDFRVDILNNLEVRHRLSFAKDLSISKVDGRLFDASIKGQLNSSNPRKLLVFLDLTIDYIKNFPLDIVPFENSFKPKEDVLKLLDEILENGSKWRVSEDDGIGLVERVDENLTEVAKVINNNHLTKAWNEAFGLNPNPEHAVEYAQKAVESVASASGLTKTHTSVFGNVIGDIKAHPDKYSSAASGAFSLNDALSKASLGLNDSFALWVASGMDFIQKSNPGRHQSSATDSFKLSPEAAQQAVLIATLLCHLFSKGGFKKVS